METITGPVGCNFIEHPKDAEDKTDKVLNRYGEISICLTLRPKLTCTCGKYSIKWEVSTNGSHRS